jgi:hypothetical protein
MITRLCALQLSLGTRRWWLCLVEELGASVNLATKYGVTPLMFASAKKHEKIVRYLLKIGADAQATHVNLRTAAVDVSNFFEATAEQTAYLEARTHCANPGCKGAGLKKCANCKEAFFCSTDCQVAAWPAHKVECKRRVEAKTNKLN